MQIRLLLDLLLLPAALGRVRNLQAAIPSTIAPPITLPCLKPVRRAEVKFPDHLLAGPVADRAPMYSGYVNVTSEDYLFYWFVEAETGAADAPTIVWSNGGPGCSAMEGATTEIGPLVLFNVKPAGASGFSGKLSRNRYSWNRRANILFVDQPRYVGFSCGTGPYVVTSQEAGRDMVKFLQGWRSLFPEKAGSFILASESYGGHYVPAWTRAILDHNARVSTADQIDIAGLAIGNGIIDEKLQNDKSLAVWAGEQNLLTAEGIPLTAGTTHEMMIKTLGYLPNYYDYRLQDLGDCCGCFSYNYSSWARWLMQQDVRDALHVCGNAGSKSFDGCSGGCISFPNEFDQKVSPHEHRDILGQALQLGIPVLLFYGMQDFTCNYVGGYTVASALQWSGASRWAKTPSEPLTIAGTETGTIQAAQGLTWIQIDNAGHMASVDNPAAAHFAIDKLISDVEAKKRSHIVMQKNEHLSMGTLYSPATAPLFLALGSSVCALILLSLAYAACGRRAISEGEKNLRSLVQQSSDEEGSQ